MDRGIIVGDCFRHKTEPCIPFRVITGVDLGILGDHFWMTLLFTGQYMIFQDQFIKESCDLIKIEE